ncbi:MAG: CidA/LrgA family protein [Lachnospiraceae bacterium]|nr:CidA/LrgA family protein [Lachnospiraceae bacterium]
MKILKQIMVIGSVTFAGELCSMMLPLPVPASVYGMLLMFLCLQSGVIKLSQIEDTADFLVSVMPVMFVAPCVSLMDSIGGVLGSIPVIVLICLVTTVTTISVTGVVAQSVIRMQKAKTEDGCGDCDSCDDCGDGTGSRSRNRDGKNGRKGAEGEVVA